MLEKCKSVSKMNDYRCNILIKIDSFPVSKAIRNYTGRKENPIYNSNQKEISLMSTRQHR